MLSIDIVFAFKWPIHSNSKVKENKRLVFNLHCYININLHIIIRIMRNARIRTTTNVTKVHKCHIFHKKAFHK